MKIDKKILIILIMGIVILGISLVFAYNYISIKAYEEGISDATLIINNQIKTNLEQNGYINYIYPINETNAVQIRLGVIPNE